MPETTQEIASKTPGRNDAAPLIQLAEGTPDGLAWWTEQSFRYREYLLVTLPEA
jgi:hypothetical protein